MSAIFNAVKATSLPASPAVHTLYYIKGGSDVRVKGYVTDATGTAFPLGIIDEQDVLGVMLDGFTVGTNAPINSSNTIFTSFRNIQAQLNTLSTAVAGGIKIPLPIDCSTNPNYPSAAAGDSYLVTVGGRIGGASGKLVQAGDKIIAQQTNAGGNQATVGTAWYIINGNIDIATTEIAGVTRIATSVEVDAGTDNFAYVTPTTLRGGVRNTPLTGYAVGANTAISATDSVLGAFGKVQGQLNNKVGGSGTAGQVSFWTGAGVQSGDNGLVWDNVGKNLSVSTNIAGGSSSIRINGLGLNGTSVAVTIISSIPEGFGAASTMAFSTRNSAGTISEKWSILSSGIFESNGPQTIQTRSGTEALTLQLNGGNTILNPSIGNVGIGTSSPLAKLEVNADSGIPAIRTLRTLQIDIATFLPENQAYQRLRITTADIRRGATVRLTWSSRSMQGIPSNYGGTATLGIQRVDGGAGFYLFKIENPSGNSSISMDTPVASGNDIIFAFRSGNNGSGTTYNLDISVEIVSQTLNSFVVEEITGTIPSTGSSLFGANTTYTNNTARISITSAGNVGIGTTEPAFKLDVNGTANFSGSTSFNGGANTIKNNSELQWKDTGGAAQNVLFMFTNNDVMLSSPVAGSSLIFRGVGYATRMSIIPNGNVGIGTTAPAYKLQVVGDGSLYTSDNSTGSTALRLGSSLSMPQGIATVVGTKSAVGTGYLSLSTAIGGSGPTERMRIDSTGNVGIGTTAPDEKLHVAGKILVGTRTEAPGNFATFSTAGVLQEQTVAQVRATVMTWTDAQW